MYRGTIPAPLPPPLPPDQGRPERSDRSGGRQSCPICGCDDCQCSSSSIPQDLIERDHWVTWCRELRNGKLTKVPYCPTTGRNADSTKSQTWGSFVSATEAARRRRHDGIGYVFAPDDPFAGVDLDHCRDALTGELSDEARAVVESFASYAELSPSGEGVHIYIRARMPGGKGRKRNPYEAYSQCRFFTVSGQQLADTPATIEERQDELDAFLTQCLPERETKRAAVLQQYAHHRAPLGIDDGAILRAAMKDTKFADLWLGNTSGYGSASEADFALCRKLEFYAGGDADVMDRLFRRSGCMRDKWDERRGDSTYGAVTIAAILATSPGAYASYTYRSACEDAASNTEVTSDADGDDTAAMSERAPVNLCAYGTPEERIAHLEAMLAATSAAKDAMEATKDATIAQLEHDLASCRAANKRLSAHHRELIEYKRSRDEAEERRQLIWRLPSKRLSVTQKAVLDCGTRLIRSAQSRGVVRDDGAIRLPLGALCDALGISDDAASKAVRYLDETIGIWKRDSTPEFDPVTGQVIRRLYVVPNEDFLRHPEKAIAVADEVQVPVRNHGGPRVRCVTCGSDDIVARTVWVCRGCGEEWNEHKRPVNAASPEIFPHPQGAASEESLYMLPQGAASGAHPARPPAASSAATRSLCIHEREHHASPEKVSKPQDVGTTYMRESAERRQQQYDIWRWARANNWTRLTYSPGTSTGGNEDAWGFFLRQAGKADLARAWAAISPDAAEAPREEWLA